MVYNVLIFVEQLPWPRTQSERLLVDMFEGSGAQMLCLLETIQDSNRRTLLSSPPAADSEVEILDVFAELFMAAQEIIAGREQYPSTCTLTSALQNCKYSSFLSLISLPSDHFAVSRGDSSLGPQTL